MPDPEPLAELGYTPEIGIRKAARRERASRRPGSRIEAAGVAARLVVDLIEGGPETKSAPALLKTGFLVWIYTIIACAFLYWVLDGGGPESRFLAPREFPELAFPAQLNPGIAPRDSLMILGLVIARAVNILP